MFVGYAEEMNDAHWYPGKEAQEPETEELRIRVPKWLKDKIEAIAAAETAIWELEGKRGAITINKVVDGALARFAVGYEETFGPLPTQLGDKKRKAMKADPTLLAYAQSVWKARQKPKKK